MNGGPGASVIADAKTDTFSSGAVCDLVEGLTYRRLHYWTTQGYISPAKGKWSGGSGKGNWVKWTSDQITRLRIICGVLDELGMSGTTTGGVIAAIWDADIDRAGWLCHDDDGWRWEQGLFPPCPVAIYVNVKHLGDA